METLANAATIISCLISIIALYVSVKTANKVKVSLRGDTSMERLTDVKVGN